MADDFQPQPDPTPLAQPFSLSGRVALVVGAGDPLGRAAAVSLAEAGADVACATLRAGMNEIVRVNSVANEVWSLGRRNLALTLDAADETSVDAAMTRVEREWGRLDILVNAPDLVAAAPIEELSAEDWQTLLTANLVGPALCCRAAAGLMKGAGYGRVINVASVLSARGVRIPARMRRRMRGWWG